MVYGIGKLKMPLSLPERRALSLRATTRVPSCTAALSVVTKRDKPAVLKLYWSQTGLEGFIDSFPTGLV